MASLRTFVGWVLWVPAVLVMLAGAALVSLANLVAGKELSL